AARGALNTKTFNPGASTIHHAAGPPAQRPGEDCDPLAARLTLRNARPRAPRNALRKIPGSRFHPAFLPFPAPMPPEMQSLETEILRRRTFAIVSHPDAGKT